MAKTLFELLNDVANTEPPKKREVEALKFYLPQIRDHLDNVLDFLKAVTVVAESNITVRLTVPKDVWETIKDIRHIAKRPLK